MKKGFTLIELLIIVAIVGILAAVIIQRVAEWRDKSRINAKYEALIENQSYRRDILIAERDAELRAYELKRKAEVSGIPAPVAASGTYRLQDGHTVECSRVETMNGMMYLQSCDDGKSYLAQTNVVKIK